MFTIYPAIDLKGGRCVRLLQGKADAETVYGHDPVAMARRWVDEGARWLHVVDLDGAFEGRPAHTEVIRNIVAAVPVPVQVGGGLRTDEHLKELAETGVSRMILGTRAWEKPDALAALAERYGEAIAVGIDARDGLVQIRGWTETTSLTAVDLARQADAMGIRTLIITDTATDGMLQGVNAAAMDEVCAAVACNVIASGGVSTAEDVARLQKLGRDNLIGAIVGKALYEGRVSLQQLQAG
ncbi:MAG: 1-(5-phosphoribosyl)-5-[(5-phosphoribosylamino)methylideneamino]imidazole-4-carboxamide isomerase [Kiritimatiellae bacterium]|nr:1-(5-phosphoribosyl)-5-[(5-phosphoribosylamino)methylideneamino]imidazole-4-carboxamide isomerase [Kiritimatiellia bacterium]